jgi:FkbM family methyltransferase
MIKIWIFILIIIIYKYKQHVIYNISLLSSKIICNKTKINHYVKCNNIFINNNDLSGPANSARLGLSWENWLKNIIKKYSNLNKSALDIGAHIGIHTINMSKYFKKVYSFEPNLNIIDNLKLNTQKLNNIIIYNKAVGNENKMVNFIVEDINTHSFVENFTENKNKNIQQIKIDDLNISDSIAFIKIDIEGGEINAFKGMYNLINRNNPVIVYEDHNGENTIYLKKHHNYKIYKINSTNFIAIK